MSTAVSKHEGVLHFASDWLPNSEVFIYDLLTHLRRRGVVVAANRLQNTDRFPFAEVHSLARIERFVHPVAARPLVISAALDIVRIRYRAGIVHAHHGYRVNVPLSVVRKRHLPFVLSLHGHDVTGYLDHVRDPYKEAVDLASAVIVPSRFLVDLAVAAGFDLNRIRVLPSGIDTNFFIPTPIPPESTEVLFVGRFVAKKGLDVLAAAWPDVQRAVPDARLRLLGFGPLEPVARSITGKVTVHLSPTRASVRDAIQAARVVVSPSHVAPDDALESLLMVNLEAQASGRPVVTTRHGGIPEFVVDGSTALLIDENDPDQLAEALVRILTDDELAACLGAAGPAWAQTFDVRRTSAAVDLLYDELLETTSPVSADS